MKLLFNLFFIFLFTSQLFGDYVPARVLKITKKSNIMNQPYLKAIEKVKVKVLSGKYKGKIIEVNNYIWKGVHSPYSLKIKKGEEVVINIEYGTGFVALYYRIKKYIILFVLFLLIFILVSGLKAIKAILALFLIYAGFVYIFFPLVMKNYSPVIISFLILIPGTILTFYLVLDNNIKRVIAITGALSGLLSAFIISLLYVWIGGLKGYETTIARILPLYNVYTSPVLFFIAGSIVASSGGIMDISAAISSTLYEFKKTHPGIDYKKLYMHGLNVLRDISGTMVNTIIFATVAHLVIYIIVFKLMLTPSIVYTNWEFLILALLPLFAGTFGLITAGYSALICGSSLLTGKFKIPKLFLFITLSIILFIPLFKMFSWVTPPDKEFYRHPVSKIYRYRKKETYALGIVKKVYPENIEEAENQQMQKLNVKIITGKFKGKVIKSVNYLYGDPAKDIFAKKGHLYVFWINFKKSKVLNSILFQRFISPVVVLFFILCGFLLYLTGKIKGLRIFAGLIFTIFFMSYIFATLVIKGISIFILTILSGFLILVIIIYSITGKNRVFLPVLISTGLMAILCYLSGFIIGKYLKINGFSHEEIQLLNYFNQVYKGGVIKNVSILIYTVIIFGAIGAIIDVGISIGSALNEIKSINPEVTFKELYSHGLSIGKDITGTMVNTLILGYLGINLPLLIFWYSGTTSYMHFFNLEFVAVEIAKGITGTIGFILLVPVASFVSSYFYRKETYWNKF